jgi:hypothetical protein
MTADNGKSQLAKVRDARLAAALRENLKRRKAQARERADDDRKTPETGSAAEDAGHGPDFRRNRSSDYKAASTTQTGPETEPGRDSGAGPER